MKRWKTQKKIKESGSCFAGRVRPIKKTRAHTQTQKTQKKIYKREQRLFKPANLIESTDEGRHSIFSRLGVGRLLLLLWWVVSGGGGLAGSSEICGAVAEVVNWRYTVEQFVFRFRQFEGNLFGERQQTLENVELVREWRRKGQHPSWKSRSWRRRRKWTTTTTTTGKWRRWRGWTRSIHVLVRMATIQWIRRSIRSQWIRWIEMLLQIPKSRSEILKRRRWRYDNIPFSGAKFKRHSIVRSPATQLPLQ